MLHVDQEDYDEDEEASPAKAQRSRVDARLEMVITIYDGESASHDIERVSGKGTEEKERSFAVDSKDTGEAEAEAEDMAARHGCKMFVSNHAERVIIIKFMTAEGMGNISQEVYIFRKKALAVARQIRAFRPTKNDDETDLETFGY